MEQLLATTAVDGSILIVLGISTVIGLFRGMVKEVLSLVIWVGAFIIARLASPTLEPLLLGYIGSSYLRSAIAFGAVFLACLAAGGLLSRFTASMVKASGLLALDKVLGSVFGALRGAVVCIVVLLALRPFCDDYLWWGQSFFVQRLLAFDEAVLSLIDGTVRLANEDLVPSE